MFLRSSVILRFSRGIQTSDFVLDRPIESDDDKTVMVTLGLYLRSNLTFFALRISRYALHSLRNGLNGQNDLYELNDNSDLNAPNDLNTPRKVPCSCPLAHGERSSSEIHWALFDESNNYMLLNNALNDINALNGQNDLNVPNVFC